MILKCLCEFDVLNEYLDTESLKTCSPDRGMFDIPGVAPALEREEKTIARGVDTGGGTRRAPSVFAFALANCLVD